MANIWPLKTVVPIIIFRLTYLPPFATRHFIRPSSARNKMGEYLGKFHYSQGWANKIRQPEKGWRNFWEAIKGVQTILDSPWREGYNFQLVPKLVPKQHFFMSFQFQTRCQNIRQAPLFMVNIWPLKNSWPYRIIYRLTCLPAFATSHFIRPSPSRDNMGANT